jgi:ABC-2 type transport system permease protein
MKNFLSGFAGSFCREIGRMREDPALVIFSVFIPLLTVLFMYYLFIDGVPRSLPVAVCDQDHSQMSRGIERAVNSTPSARVFFHVSSPAEGKQLIIEKKAYSLIVIPKNFQKDVERGAAPRIVHYYNNIYLLAGSLVYKDVLTAVGTVSAQVKSMKLVQSGVASSRVKDYALPVSLESQRLFNPYTNYQYYLAAGFMPTVFQMFVILSFIFALGIELKEGTAGGWMKASGGSVYAALAGKAVPYFLCFLTIGIFMETMLLRFADIPLEGNIVAIFISLLLFILAGMSVGFFFIAAFANLRFALSAGAFYTAIAFTFSGLTFPLIAIPPGVRCIGEFIPLTHYLRIFIGQSLRGAPIDTNYQFFGILVLFCILPAFMIPRWRRMINDHRYWGGI